MTENQAIQKLEYIKTFDEMNYGANKIALDMAIQALKENQKYKEIGTVEEFRELKKQHIKEIELKDIVLFAYEKGLFSVEDDISNGCIGIYCKYNMGSLSNSFYCFSDSDYYISKEGYISDHTKEEIARDITYTIKSFIENNAFIEEAIEYLYGMKRLCEKENKTDYLDCIQNWIDKAEKIFKEEYEFE